MSRRIASNFLLEPVRFSHGEFCRILRKIVRLLHNSQITPSVELYRGMQMKIDISVIDKNFLNGSVYESDTLLWKNIHDEPFEIRGLAVHEGETFCRLPLDLLKNCSEGINVLAYHTAGARVRFTLKNASRLALRCESLNSGSMSHMPLTGSAGVDIYINGEFRQAIRPANDRGGFFEGETKINSKTAQVEINLPLYNGIRSLYIGTEQEATVCAPKPYRLDVPVVYYGSSITQGGCASRPGNSYQGFLSRRLQADHINLGFSGAAKGEDELANYIAGLNMSSFVYDYDHNAPNVEHLKNTHERFFRLIRKAQPELPVIFVPKPDCDNDPSDSERRNTIILETYRRALAAGDRNVYYVDGKKLFGRRNRDACTVDRTHPNDIGFYRMAEAIYPVLRQALRNAGRI